MTQTQARTLILDVRTDLAVATVQRIREQGVLIVTIDDPSERRLVSDLAFYPPVPQVARLDWTGFTGQRFVGWDWVLLRPQFAEAARRARAREAESMAWSPSDDRQLTLLVTMGGSDPAGLTLMALEAIEKIDGDFRVLVVVGNGFMHEAALADWLASAKRTYQVRRDVTDMASLMTEADLGIAAFGVTAYELAAMNVPAIYLCLSDDHAESASALMKQRFGISLGYYKNKSAESALMKIAETIAFLCNSENDINKSAVDGLGAVRIARIIGEAYCSYLSTDPVV